LLVALVVTTFSRGDPPKVGVLDPAMSGDKEEEQNIVRNAKLILRSFDGSLREQQARKQFTHR